MVDDDDGHPIAGGGCGGGGGGGGSGGGDSGGGGSLRHNQQQLQQPPRRVSYTSMPEAAKADLWTRFHAALEPMRAAGKLGCVVFQFHLSFPHSAVSKQHVEELRRRLDPRMHMAVEFRNRDWVVGAAGEDTVQWCRARQLALVAADELHHETMQTDRDQRGLRPGDVWRMLPTRLEATCDWGTVVRVHRRHGREERLLGDDEIRAWAGRVTAVAPVLRGKGPVWVAWGTDWGDAPLINSQKLAAQVGEAVALDWAAAQRDRARSGGVAGLFARATATSTSVSASASSSAAASAASPAAAAAVASSLSATATAAVAAAAEEEAAVAAAVASVAAAVAAVGPDGNNKKRPAQDHPANLRTAPAAGAGRAGAAPSSAKRSTSSSSAIAKMFAKHNSP